MFSQHFHLTPAQLAALPIHIQVRADGTAGTVTARWPLTPSPTPQVLNSRAIRADAIIGAFKVRVTAGKRGGETHLGPFPPLSTPTQQLDVGTVYNAPGRGPCRVPGARRVTELHRGDVGVPNRSRAQAERDVAEPAAPPAPRCWMLWVPPCQRSRAACR